MWSNRLHAGPIGGHFQGTLISYKNDNFGVDMSFYMHKFIKSCKIFHLNCTLMNLTIFHL